MGANVSIKIIKTENFRGTDSNTDILFTKDKIASKVFQKLILFLHQ